MSSEFNLYLCSLLFIDCNYFVAIYNFCVLMEVNRQAFFALQVLACVERLCLVSVPRQKQIEIKRTGMYLVEGTKTKTDMKINLFLKWF
jgi:hypothetical protein